MAKPRQYYSPAEWVARVMGSKGEIARTCKISASAVSRWFARDGHVPGKEMFVILKAAQKRGLDITANDLICGRHE